jgi:type IV pilus assembly protein PilM
VSLPNDQVQKYKRIFQLAGLNLTALEVEGFSLARALTRGDDEPVLIVDIGARSSTFLVAQNGLLKSMGQSDFAGGSLTQSLASGLGINVRRAEDLKKQKGLTGLGYAPEEELSTLLLPLLDVIISEVKRVKEGYESSYQQAVKKVILTGGGANLPGIEKYFSDQLGAVIVKANPFSQMQFSPKLEPLVSNIGPLLSVAVGLALKPFV